MTKPTWLDHFIEIFLAFNAFFFLVSGFLYSLTDASDVVLGNPPDGNWLWLSRTALSLLCFGFLGILRVLKRKENGLSSRKNS